ncbi:unnamed protein product [Brassica napus]|uniref:(rape) hypothetical protein n=1 Tax=Brassica napus TaxID=3708 RepID=A0A816Z3R6_BRANA|nr:unnamed protein product [Brassica napus]
MDGRPSELFGVLTNVDSLVIPSLLVFHLYRFSFISWTCFFFFLIWIQNHKLYF